MNSSSEDSNLLKTQLSKIIQLGEFLSRLLVPLMKVSLPLMKIVLMALAKSVLLPLVLTAAVSAESGASGSGTVTITILNKEMRDVMIKVKSLKESGILIKGVTQTIENETKERRGGFFSILLGTPGANVFRNKLAGKG